ncbi:MAG: restriction endonuclease [Fulvivirga sp.]
MKKSPIDVLFYELFGFYPNKAGSAYEILTAAAIRIITGEEVELDQRVKGNYSDTIYQVDGVTKSHSHESMIEAKDYTIQNKKVGRGDIQKLQGALSDLRFKEGLFTSATDFTKPAKKYAESSFLNPAQKPVRLYQIRPSTEEDEKGRIKKFEITMVMVLPNFQKAKYKYAWTEEAVEKFKKNGLANKQISIKVDTLYEDDGSFATSIQDFTHDNQPILMDIDDELAKGCWVFGGLCIKHESEYYGLKGIDYEIPYYRSSSTFTIESEGKPKIYVASENGDVNKLITDKQLRETIRIKK